LSATDTIELIDGEFKLSIHGKESPTRIRKLYEGWLYKAAYDTFLVKVKQYSKLINVEIKKINIKNMKQRWGAITKVGEINLNVLSTLNAVIRFDNSQILSWSSYI
jgi:predicted metal-dependent hydrolase